MCPCACWSELNMSNCRKRFSVAAHWKAAAGRCRHYKYFSKIKIAAAGNIRHSVSKVQTWCHLLHTDLFREASFGLASAPATLQHKMSIILKGSNNILRHIDEIMYGTAEQKYYKVCLWEVLHMIDQTLPQPNKKSIFNGSSFAFCVMVWVNIALAR